MPFKQLPYYRGNHHLFSAQKSGRTWIRMILARVLFQIGENPHKLEMIPSFHSAYPDIQRKKKPAKMNIIFLHRDPRDCVVSRYFEVTRRRRDPPKSKDPKKVYNNTLSQYVKRDDQYGIRAIISYMNDWVRNLDSFKSSLVISYEDLHGKPLKVINDVLCFIGIDCSQEKTQEAIDYSSFQEMQRIERTGVGNLLKNYHGTFGKRHKESDPESFRTRIGKIGGFVEYLNSDDIEFVNEEMRLLENVFGYEEMHGSN